ncbi:MAG TPA: Ig-like domain-containing protein [Gemmatimonadaceae bacterium]|jgi:hypothetical protein|nr:Ig-like domain-containing protein [Gemmatimonadaceae bacterium]
MSAVRTLVAPALVVALSAACANGDSNGGVDPSSLTATDNRMSLMSVAVTPGSDTLKVGATDTLHVTTKGLFAMFMSGKQASASWSSSDTTVAKVSSAGIVTGMQAGIAQITAKSGMASGTGTITVQGAAEAVTPPVTTPPVTKTTTSETSTSQSSSISTTPVTTTTPPTTTTSTTTTSGSGTGVTSMSMLSDDFSEYANTAAFLAKVSSNIGGTASPSSARYTDGANANLAAIDNTVLYNGHPTLKYNQPGGMANSPELWVGFSPTLTHIWFRTKIRFSPGFTTTGTLTNSANAYKLLGWGWNNYYGSGRLEISNTTQYQLYWTALAESNSATVGGGTTGIAGNITTEWSDGGWYDYIIEVDYSQGPTGTARVWMAKDGQTPVLQTTSSGTMQGGAPLPTLNQIMLGMNFNQTRAASQTQALWYGQWELIDGSQHADPYGLGAQ